MVVRLLSRRGEVGRRIKRSMCVSSAEKRIKGAFPLRSENCDVLETPSCFHRNMLKHIRSSKDRISLASLYFGTGQKEREIVEEIRSACKRNPELKVSVLLDHSRGTRKSPLDGTSSMSMLTSLCNEFPEQFSLALFLMPQLWGECASRIPARWNEIVAVMHVKAYVFDDTLLMSGANLSEDYFTNRQDRYLVMSNMNGLAGLYHDFVELLSRYSDVVSSNGTKILATRNSALRDKLRYDLHDFASSYQHKNESVSSSYDSWVLPTFQFGELDLFQDEEMISKLLRSTSHESVDIATGYFNMPESMMNLLLHDCDIKMTRILMSSPEAHGFHSAKGISGALPLAYAERSRLCFERIQSESNHKVSLHEYIRDDWTYHAKGVWFTSSSETLPSLSVIGSSNFGMRSQCRDIESQLYIGSTDSKLRESWNHERNLLFNYAYELNRDILSEDSRKIRGMSLRSGYWIRPVSRMISRFM